MTAPATQTFTVNGRAYGPPPRPVVVVCLDGSADDYLNAAIERGKMPNLLAMALGGYRGLARGALPSFTNVNNVSIVTGVPPCVHGVSGNFFFDTASGQEVMMNSACFLRADTILAAAAKSGRKVAVVTAKEKLRDLFAHGLVGDPPAGAGGIAFSAERANQAQPPTHGLGDVEVMVGRPTPPIYSADASLYVLRAGAELVAHGRADFLYLSTTDYVQHKFSPAEPEALEFYRGVDEQLGRLLGQGAVVGLTADHGMNWKRRADGQPNVIYLESALVRQFGPGFRVILPITDPYVVHHGALGSFAVVHLPPGQTSGPVQDWLLQLDGVTEVHDRASAVRKLELPADRIGELIVLSGRDVVLGRTPEWHDLKVIEGGLRSHGGRYEEMVPFILSRPLKPDYLRRAQGDPRNFDIFDFTLNGTSHE